MYFTAENAAAIDAVRDTIAMWSGGGRLDRVGEQLLLASLIQAADRVANTTGVCPTPVNTGPVAIAVFSVLLPEIWEGYADALQIISSGTQIYIAIVVMVVAVIGRCQRNANDPSQMSSARRRLSSSMPPGPRMIGAPPLRTPRIPFLNP